MYEKEDVDQHVDLKKMWSNYLKRKEEVMDHYEAVKQAQNIDIDDILLPSNNDNENNGPGDIPLPPNLSMAPKVCTYCYKKMCFFKLGALFPRNHFLNWTHHLELILKKWTKLLNSWNYNIWLKSYDKK